MKEVSEFALKLILIYLFQNSWRKKLEIVESEKRTKTTSFPRISEGSPDILDQRMRNYDGTIDHLTKKLPMEFGVLPENWDVPTKTNGRRSLFAAIDFPAGRFRENKSLLLLVLAQPI